MKTMDSLRTAPRHDHCNGVCEGCTAYPKCPERVICDDTNCRHSSYSLYSPLAGFWDCEKLEKISDEVFELVDAEKADANTPPCPYFEPFTPEEIKEKEAGENFREDVLKPFR